MGRYVCYFDGACEPRNPGGNLGIGAIVISPSGEKILEHSEYIPAQELSGNTSNNMAEYIGAIRIMEFFISNGMQRESILICGDSRLVIEQLRGTWKAKSGAYIPYYNKAKDMLSEFPSISFEWIPRERNTMADALSKDKMKENGCEIGPWNKSY